METKTELNSLIVEDKNMPENPKKIKKSKSKKNIVLVIEEDDNVNEFNNKYVIQKIEENKNIKFKKIIDKFMFIVSLINI